jgi:protocatechuate 3,4-dioxygenase beta subunit
MKKFLQVCHLTCMIISFTACRTAASENQMAAPSDTADITETDQTTGSAPTLEQLTDGDEPGDRLLLIISLQDAVTGSPITDAEIWLRQTDNDGYYREDEAGIPRIQGTFFTDATGLVQVLTILPGRYPGDPTASRHIHLTAEAAGYAPAERVILFDNDPYLTQEERTFEFALVADVVHAEDETWLAEVRLELTPADNDPDAAVN